MNKAKGVELKMKSKEANLFDIIYKNGTTYEDYLAYVGQISNINYVGYNNRSYLHLSLQNKYYEIFDDLLQRGIDVNIQDDAGNTSAVYAASGKQWECVYKILDHHPDVDVQNRKGETLLIKVLEYAGKFYMDDRYKLLKRLVDMGADPLIPNICGLTSMRLAELQGDEKAVEIFKRHIFSSDTGITDVDDEHCQ